jgi:hypothetical protein
LEEKSRTDFESVLKYIGSVLGYRGTVVILGGHALRAGLRAGLHEL